MNKIRIVSEEQFNIVTVQIVPGVFIVWKNRKNIWWRKRRYPIKKITILSDHEADAFSEKAAPHLDKYV